MQPRDQVLTDMHEPDQWFKGRMYWSNVGKEDEPNYKKVGLETRSSPLCWLFVHMAGIHFGIPTHRGSTATFAESRSRASNIRVGYLTDVHEPDQCFKAEYRCRGSCC